jgi:hypothetical protein
MGRTASGLLELKLALALLFQAAGLVVLHVVAQVAALAHGLQVLLPAILGLVVEVGDGEDDLTASVDGRLPVMLDAPPTTVKPALTGTLTTATGPLEAYPLAVRLPVRRVAVAVLFSYRHAGILGDHA